MTSDEVSQMKKAILAHVNAVTDEAEAMPFPQPADLYPNVYEGTHEPWL